MQGQLLKVIKSKAIQRPGSYSLNSAIETPEEKHCSCCGSKLHTNCECEREVYDPYNITIHDKILRRTHSNWTTTKLERTIQRTIIGIIVNFIIGIYDIIIEEYFDKESRVVNPIYLIEHRLQIDYVKSYDWSGKIVALKKHFYKIADVDKYYSTFKENRQVGQALYEQKLVDGSTGRIITKLWSNREGFSGSIDDLRCGEPYISQDLFFTCNPN